MRMKMSVVVKLSAAAALLLSAQGCDWMRKKDPPGGKSESEIKADQEARIRRACASEGTYDRLKELAFDEAARIRRTDSRELDALAASSVVRMENPVVASRDERLNVTVCRGRFILELPPGIENAFDGERRLAANIEYAAQAAVDGSGLVYNMQGAEPIIYRLATIGGVAVAQAQPVPVPVPVPGPAPKAQAQPPAPAAPAQARPPAEPTPPPAREPERAPAPEPPQPKAKAQQPTRVAAATPSFNCRYARTFTERMICGNERLAARDREMASIYYSAMTTADIGARSHLRRSRDAFLSRRERCRTEECVQAIYDARISEIRRIAGGD